MKKTGVTHRRVVDFCGQNPRTSYVFGPVLDGDIAYRVADFHITRAESEQFYYDPNNDGGSVELYQIVHPLVEQPRRAES